MANPVGASRRSPLNVAPKQGQGMNGYIVEGCVPRYRLCSILAAMALSSQP